MQVYYSRSENAHGEKELLAVHLKKTADLKAAHIKQFV